MPPYLMPSKSLYRAVPLLGVVKRTATHEILLLVKVAPVYDVPFSLDKIASGIIADIFLYKS